MKKIERLKSFFSASDKKETYSTKKIKSDTIKSAIPHRVLRIIFWILIAFLIIKGAVSLLHRTSSDSVENVVQQKILQSEKQAQIRSEAAAFAEEFSEEYMTYKVGDTEGYQKRLSKYLPSYLSSTGLNISGKCDVQAVEATTISSDFYSENQVNVDVRVKVEYLEKTDNSGSQNNNVSTQTSSQVYNDIFLRVPIIQNGGKYIVEDMPMVIPSQDVATLNVKNYSGNTADDENADIKVMLQSFLKTYCEGNDTELNYFMSDSKANIKGLKGSFKFKEIDDVKSFYMNDKNTYLVLCSYTVVDSNSSQEFKQDLHINVIKKDGRYYIKNFDTRSINLKSDGGNTK